MKIPNFERVKFVDDNGFLTDHWNKILGNLFSELRKNFSNEGAIMPHQSTADLVSLAVSSKSGGLFYDKDTKKLKVNLDGIMKEVATL